MSEKINRETYEMMMGMDLHSIAKLDNGLMIFRVPGGWFYVGSLEIPAIEDNEDVLKANPAFSNIKNKIGELSIFVPFPPDKRY